MHILRQSNFFCVRLASVAALSEWTTASRVFYYIASWKILILGSNSYNSQHFTAAMTETLYYCTTVASSTSLLVVE